MNFTPEVKYEAIKQAVSQKLYTPLVHPSNKVWRESTQTKTLPSTFQIRNYIRYHNEGHNEMAEMVDINNNDTDRTKYSIYVLRGNTIIVTTDFLKSRNMPDNVTITIQS